MGPSEIVASLKELCATSGPKLTTDMIVNWIENMGGYESHFELVQFAKKMKSRQYARCLEFEDPESKLRIKRLWSFYDSDKQQRFYRDILDLPEDERRDLVRQYSLYLKQMRSVRRALSDYFRGQQFFSFYPGDPDEDDERAEIETRLPGIG